MLQDKHSYDPKLFLSKFLIDRKDPASKQLDRELKLYLEKVATGEETEALGLYE